MRLATLRTEDGTRAVRVEDAVAVDLGLEDVGAVLGREDWAAWAAAQDGPRRPMPEQSAEVTYAPLVVRPGKILCVGLNYASHIQEMGRELPEFPTLFAKFPESLVGAHDDIVVPDYAADAVDWEVELALVVGRTVRNVPEADAPAAIAGYTVLNDISMRDWQNRTTEWLQGKTFEGSTPLGPVLVTPDELDGAAVDVTAIVDGETMQEGNTADLVFSAAHLVSYISRIITLHPGDVIATGTPGGVGHARDPKRYLTDGSTVEARVAGIGATRNRVTVATRTG